MIGNFVIAKVFFAEDDGRYKLRPCLVIDKAKTQSGQIIYLVAPKYSATEKVRGDIEVVMGRAAATAVGLDKEGVVRFDKDSLRAVAAKDVVCQLGHYKRLDPLMQTALQRAACRIGITI